MARPQLRIHGYAATARRTLRVLGSPARSAGFDEEGQGVEEDMPTQEVRLFSLSLVVVVAGVLGR